VSTVKQEETRVKFRCKSERQMSLWIRALHYLLTGGYGHWYPNEIRDTDNIGNAVIVFILCGCFFSHFAVLSRFA
jgi:hypothetical protein